MWDKRSTIVGTDQPGATFRSMSMKMLRRTTVGGKSAAVAESGVSRSEDGLGWNEEMSKMVEELVETITEDPLLQAPRNPEHEVVAPSANRSENCLKLWSCPMGSSPACDLWTRCGLYFRWHVWL